MLKILNKVSLLYHTVRYLKLSQLFYQLYYRVFTGRFVLKPYNQRVRRLNLMRTDYPFGTVKRSGDGFYFNFLNKSVVFDKAVDWTYDEYGKLWTFNLNYFDFLTEKRLSDADKQHLVLSYLPEFENNVVGKASYTISLRAYNWIKYINTSGWHNETVIQHLYAQYTLLYKRFEYHILANHLLENALSLLFAAFFFEDEIFLRKAKREIYKELKEQICDDGAHYERSVMYHCVLLGRLIEVVYLLKHNSIFKDSEFVEFVERKVALMLSFLANVKFSCGEIPMFNDAVRGAFPSVSSLFQQKEKANIKTIASDLSDSGYRRIVRDDYELVADVGGILPSYQPGHAHADSFTFELYYKEKPLVVDVGTSTYENGALRQFERSTLAHNSVAVSGLNQSQVWGGFRVAKRVTVDVVESKDRIEATIVPFDKSLEHRRELLFDHGRIVISDSVKGKNGVPSLAKLHFHPDCDLRIKDKNTIVVDGVSFCIEGAQSVKVEDYQYAYSFNLRTSAKCCVVEFFDHIITRIIF